MTTERNIAIAVTGFGSIGRRITEMLLDRREAYRQRYGIEARIVGVCGSSAGLVDPSGLEPERLYARESFVAGLTGEAFLGGVKADVLVEASPSDYVTGGPALHYLRGALGRGMHAIAVSKGALVVDLRGLLRLAGAHGGSLRMSAAAASGLPTVDFLQHSLAGCRVLSFEAVLTGTANLVLEEMMNGLPFADALALAQDRGIAEPDPSFDVEGWDTAAKLVIIANAALGADLRLDALPREGIGRIGPDDVARWRAEGRSPRLVGFLEYDGESPADDDGFRAGVELRTYGQDHPFAHLRGSMKGFSAVTDEMGVLTVVGGASDPRATAAAALKDFEHILAEC
ncbi:homoserine dehydrogenase [Sinomonas humi]|uniref:Homoserine dehydrogenase n=1 Tax=Sinomonas humi TaxID=1338436 RepID=A0A0B2ACY4_9MICC|nr:homoserine dehydrogenase [Sinomonas humi]KHL01409.1 homoserine dehydrogenase [Sinomonas humi]